MNMQQSNVLAGYEEIVFFDIGSDSYVAHKSWAPNPLTNKSLTGNWAIFDSDTGLLLDQDVDRDTLLARYKIKWPYSV